MKIKKIIVMKNGIPTFTINDSTGDDGETLESGLITAINNFSKEIRHGELHSFETTGDLKVTLLQRNDLIIAIYGDGKSLKRCPGIIRNYVFGSEDGVVEENIQERLKFIFGAHLENQEKKENAIKGLIISVGMTMTPLWHALSRHDPEHVVFIASQASASIAHDLMAFFGFELEINARLFKNDPNDITSMTRSALEGFKFLKSKGLQDKDIAVNSTGGTKGMTASVYYFSIIKNIPAYYVESKKFQKERRGDKIFGDEVIKLLANPSDSLGFYYENLARTAFNELNFSKSIEYYTKLKQVDDPDRRNVFRGLSELAAAYHHWDLFNFRQARKHLESAINNLRGSLNWDYGKHYRELCQELSKQLKLLKRIEDSRLGALEEMDLDQALLLYLELYNNAMRRANLKKHDDAVARFYRVFEATAQILLFHEHGIDVSKFKKDAGKLPPKIKEMFRKKLKSRSLLLNIWLELFPTREYPKHLPLFKSWMLLTWLNPEIEKQNILQEIEQILPVRNQSILAHGWTPIKE
ncbi:MAG: TIGR02710 family CRISPR-associated CARF protein, partial [Candidatus Helarchaeota archaeon]